MKKLKQILAIAMVVMMGMVFMPMVPGVNGIAKATGNVATIVEKSTNYTTVQEAINAAASGDTVKMIANSTENVTVASDDNLTLDLNGHVLKGAGNGSVIENAGKLTITDSEAINEAAKPTEHYYTVDANGLWTWDDSKPEGAKAFEKLTARPDKDDVIAVKGGAITGGTGTGSDAVTWGGAINNQGTLTLNEGNIVGNSAIFGGGIVLRNGSILTMNGGIVAGNASTKDGAGVFIRPGGNFAMNLGSVIKDNTATNGAGGVYVSGKFTMNGGEISNNKADSSGGGGVYVSQNDQAATKDSAATIGFEMKGGKIINNSAKRRGGGVCIDYYDLGMKMTGGEISGNTVIADSEKDANDAGGGGIWVGKSLTLGGGAVVKNNILVDKNSNTVANNVHVPLGKYSSNKIKPSISLGTDVEALRSIATIGISLDLEPTSSNPVAFTGTTNTDYSSYFTSDNYRYYVLYNTDHLELAVRVVKTAFIAQGKAYKKSIKYSWTPVEGAVTYKVYQTKCGKKYKNVKTTSATTFTKKKLQRKKAYKAYVVAYNAAGQVIAKTPKIFVMTKNGNKSNATAVTAVANATVQAGTSINVGAKIAKKDSKKKLLWKNHVSAKVRYYSADPKVATVDAAGNVTGVAAGIVNIYSVAPTGVHAVTKVIVDGESLTNNLETTGARYRF